MKEVLIQGVMTQSLDGNITSSKIFMFVNYA